MSALHTMPEKGVGLPYAEERWEPGAPGPVAICPVCDEEIPLRERKDFESFTGNEYLRHYAWAASVETLMEAGT